MQELTLNEVQDVNGGAIFVIPVAIKVGYSLIGGAIGAYSLGRAVASRIHP